MKTVSIGSVSQEMKGQMRNARVLCCLLFLSASIVQAQSDRRVVLVIIDGARYSETLGDTLWRYVPHMRSLAQQGVVLDSMVNDNITVTARAIPAIWSGSWSAPKDTVVNGAANQYATAPTVWEYFRKNRNVDSTHAMYIMKWLSTPWIQSFNANYGPAYWPWYVLQGTTDLEVWQNAKSKLQTYHPELTVLYLPDVDAAPARGWTAYTQAIVIADSIVGMLWDFIKSDPVYRNTTTMLVTNDHGRHLDGVQNGFVSHGDGCWGCRHIMFLGIGAGMPKGSHSSIRRTIPDITPTIGSLLHFPTPLATGKPMLEILTSIGADRSDLAPPRGFELEQNYPNPFNPVTTIRFELPKSARVSMEVFDLLGQRVAVLLNAAMDAGEHRVQWNAGEAASGIYFYKFSAGDFIGTKKMLLLR